MTLGRIKRTDHRWESTPKILTGKEIWLDMEGSMQQENSEELEKTRDAKFISLEEHEMIFDEIELMANQDCWDDERGEFRKNFLKKLEQFKKRVKPE